MNSRKTFNRRKLLALLGAAGITAAVEAVLPVGRAAAAAAVSKQPGLYDVSDFGAAGDGGTPDTVALKAALEAAAGSGGGSIYFPAGMYLLDESVTLPENVDLEFAPGACLYLASEVVITINGRLIAGMHQIFAGDGTVAGRIGAIDLLPEWWGAKGDYDPSSGRGTDDTAAIQAAIRAAEPAGGIVRLRSGSYLVKTLEIGRARLAGEDSAVVAANLHSHDNAPVIRVTASAAISRLHIHGSSDKHFTGQAGILVDSARGASIADCVFSGCYHAVEIRNAAAVRLERLLFQSGTRALVSGSGDPSAAPQGYEVILNGCRADLGTCMAGFIFSNAGSVRMHSLDIRSEVFAEGAVVLQSAAPSSQGIRMEGCTFSGRGPGIVFEGTSSRPVRRALIRDTCITANPAVRIGHVQNVSFDYCRFLSAGKAEEEAFALMVTDQGEDICLNRCEFETGRTPITASAECQSICLDVRDPVYYGEYPFIFLRFLPVSAIKRISVSGGTIGSNANPVDVRFPNRNVSVHVPGCDRYRNSGVYFTLGTGSFMVAIPHGLASVPGFYTVQPASREAGGAGILHLECNDQSLIVFLKNPSETVGQTLMYSWEARL